MNKNFNQIDLTINPNSDYNQYIEAIKATDYYKSAGWHVKKFMQTPQNIEAMKFAYDLSREAVRYSINFSSNENPLANLKNDSNFKYFSDENQSSILSYVQAVVNMARYESYPEAYGSGRPQTPTFELGIPFNSDGNNSSIMFDLNPAYQALEEQANPTENEFSL